MNIDKKFQVEIYCSTDYKNVEEMQSCINDNLDDGLKQVVNTSCSYALSQNTDVEELVIVITYWEPWEEQK